MSRNIWKEHSQLIWVASLWLEKKGIHCLLYWTSFLIRIFKKVMKLIILGAVRLK